MKFSLATTIYILYFYSISYCQDIRNATSLTSLNQDTAEVQDLLVMSKYYAYSNPVKMNEKADEALRLSQDINYERGVAMSLTRMGQAKLQLAEYSEALSFLLGALEIADRLHYEECTGLIYKLMANIYLHQNDISKAEEHYTKALEVAEKINDAELLIGIKNGQGNVFYARKDYKQALDTYFSVHKLAIKMNNKPKIADIESNIGKVYLAQGMSSLAIDFFQKALVTAKAINNVEEIIENSLILADYYASHRLSNESLEYARTALAAAEKMQARFFVQKSWALLAEVYGQKEEYKKAYEYNKLSKILEDSILGRDNKQQYTAINSQYENETKEKERIINNLQIEQHRKDLENQQKVTYIFITSSLIFIGLSILAFVLYKRQKKAVRQIRAQNDEINAKSIEINEQKNAIESKNEALEDAYYEIEKKNENIMASISYAKRIQTALLPDQDEINAVLTKNFIFYKPKDVISGDFYYFTDLPSINKNGTNDISILAVADCTGHGVPGAFMSVLGVQSLNKIIQEGVTAPDKILSELHKEIRQVLKQQVNEVRDGMDIILCLIDKKRKVLEYAGAINPLYYVQKNEEGVAQFYEIKATKRAIGGFQRNEGERFFEKHTIDISKPTQFYLATDGYRDQFGGIENKKFMARRFKDVLFYIHEMPMQEQHRVINETIYNWLGKNDSIDDMLVIGFELHC